MKNLFQNKLSILLVALALVAGAAYAMTRVTDSGVTPLPTGEPDGVACTMDAKICPDGTAVGRSGPNCEFAPCPDEADISSWTPQEVAELSLTFSTPPELTFTKDVQKDASGKPNLVTMYVQQGEGASQEYYQLYGIYQPSTVTAQTLEDAKTDMIEETVVDTTVGGKKAVSGQIKGQRNRLATYVLLDTGLLKLLTAEPTTRNKVLTDNILRTMKFGK